MFEEFSPPASGNSNNKKKKSKNRFSLKRTSAHIRIERPAAEGAPALPDLNSGGDVVQARLLLNDFSPGSVNLFTSVHIPTKEMVSITIEKPRQFFCKGQVVQVRRIESDSHIVMTGKPFSYRIGINFVTENEEERKTIQEYYQEIKKVA